jgi:hypothetical protein
MPFAREHLELLKFSLFVFSVTPVAVLFAAVFLIVTITLGVLIDM